MSEWQSVDWKSLDLLTVWRVAPPGQATPPEAARILNAALNILERNLDDEEKAAASLAAARSREPSALLELASWAYIAAGSTASFSEDADDSAGAEGRVRDLRGTCLWLALYYGSRYARLPLLSDLARLPAEDRGPTWLATLECLAARLPETTTPEGGLKLLGARREDGFKFKKAAPSEPLPAPAWLGLLARVLPEGSAEEGVPREVRPRVKPLFSPLPVRPWPTAEFLADRLLAEFPWAEEAIEAIAADLTLAEAVRGEATGIRPLVLLGRPGCGKSRLAGRLLNLLEHDGGPGGAMLSLAGSREDRMLRGTAAGWSSAAPSFPAQLMATTGCANPLIALDELDKAGGSHNGDPRQTLLQMLEPSTAIRWMDECIGLPVDLSRVSWLATANDKDAIPAVLRARMRFVPVPAPRPQDFRVLVGGVMQDLAAELGAEPGAVPFPDACILDAIRQGFVSGRLSARSVARLVRRAVEGAAAEQQAATRH